MENNTNKKKKDDMKELVKQTDMSYFFQKKEMKNDNQKQKSNDNKDSNL